MDSLKFTAKIEHGVIHLPKKFEEYEKVMTHKLSERITVNAEQCGGRSCVRGIMIAALLVVLMVAGNFQTAAQTRFSSVYTKNVNACGSGWTKREEKEAENRGQDIPVECKGPGGYTLNVSYSCCAAFFYIAHGKEENINLFTGSLGWKKMNAEWRLADGKPFAIIMRYQIYKFDEEKQLFSDILTSEILLVKGLTGYERIDGKIDVRTAKNPNVEARELADAGYSKNR